MTATHFPIFATPLTKLSQIVIIITETQTNQQAPDYAL
jgi:hypothetical protein